MTDLLQPPVYILSRNTELFKAHMAANKALKTYQVVFDIIVDYFRHHIKDTDTYNQVAVYRDVTFGFKTSMVPPEFDAELVKSPDKVNNVRRFKKNSKTYKTILAKVKAKGIDLKAYYESYAAIGGYYAHFYVHTNEGGHKFVVAPEVIKGTYFIGGPDVDYNDYAKQFYHPYDYEKYKVKANA